MDDLDKAIADLRKKIARWTRQAEEGAITLAAWEQAAKFRPAGPNAVRRPPDADNVEFGPETEDYPPDTAMQADDGRPGRRRGAISADWREVLYFLWMAGGAYSYAQIHDLARAKTKVDVKDTASTRDRVRSFAANNLMNGTPETGFTVTEEAAERFGFHRTLRETALPGETPAKADVTEEF